jgi:hypothetical protein
MHGPQDYLADLSRLAQLTTDEERRAAWRQGVAALAAAANQQPTPLEGLDIDGLRASVRVALGSGLVDDLGWLSKPLAATALFELAAALPQGREKRDVGRRVWKSLLEGDAPTFVSLARSLALGSRRALGDAPMRARVALALHLPIGADEGVDALALALISRPELEQEWLSAPSTGSLPSRRLAGRVLERAAREAAQRAAEGDGAAVRVFARPSVRAAWGRLLADRESLVWRHVATARGLLAPTTPELGEEIDRGLLPRQGIADWRRAAASLAATIASDPERALARCRELVAGDIVGRDGGVRVALVYGLSRACADEPQAAGALLRVLIETGELEVLEALVELRRDHLPGEVGELAVETALGRLRSLRPATDDGLSALREALERDLAPDTAAARKQPRTLRQELALALQHFAEGRPLRPAAEAALEAARRIVADLEGAGDGTPAERRRTFCALRDLDSGLLEVPVLADLVTVSGLAAGERAAGEKGAELPELLARLHDWICKREEAPLTKTEVPHPTLRLRRLRTLLHVLDVEEAPAEEEVAQARERRLRAFRLLLGRVRADAPSPLRRITCAALARACDGLVRDEMCELSDVLVAVASEITGGDDLRVLAEASMMPALKEALRALAEVSRLCGAKQERSVLAAFDALAQALPLGASPRVEALRRALGGIGRGLRAVERARGLAALRNPAEGSVLEQLGEAAQYGARLCGSARRRVGLAGPAAGPSVGAALRALDLAVERTCRGSRDPIAGALHAAGAAALADLPGPVAEVLRKLLARLAALPAEDPAGSDGESALSASDRRLPLPPWLPTSRVVGGFYVLRAIGSGAGGSVFVARRAEERHDEGAESYALKVPSYGGQNAHTLTEEQFLQLFREEAGALLTLPAHPNLAGFVNFDARARPKPILVMELVHGPTLQRLLDKRELSTGIAFSMLEGVATGLHAMHAAGVGHLDLKPANVILRVAPAASGAGSRLVVLEQLQPMAVLVDFGLAGRKIRPGCASPYFGAPEVWDTTSGQRGDPTAADVYAFSCLTYELLVGEPLFMAESLPGLIACHLSHDGNPPGLARLRADAQLAPLAEVLTAGLQPDPRHRATIGELGQALQEIARHLEIASWPLAA